MRYFIQIYIYLQMARAQNQHVFLAFNVIIQYGSDEGPGALNNRVSPNYVYYRVASFAGYFRPYDYGRLKNLKLYRQFVPPEYPIEKVTAPVILYHGLNDWDHYSAGTGRVCEIDCLFER